MNMAVCTLVVSAYLVIACNFRFWRDFVGVTGGFSLDHAPLYATSFLLLVLFLNALLTLVAFRPVAKLAFTVVLLVAAFTSYFMGKYGVLIDETMLQNVIETDVKESTELASWSMVLTVIALGVLPSVLLWRMRLEAPSAWRDLALKLVIIVVSLLGVAGLAMLNFRIYAPTFREHGEFRYMVNPANYVYSTISFLHKKRKRPDVTPIGTDAAKGALWAGRTRRTVTLVVVGETARAANFSLNGYQRETNPQLAAQEGLINFPSVQSCGTVTAVSVPCIFSALDREHFSDSTAKSQEGLLDVLKHAGFEVLWRNNNSGCKDTCLRVQYEDLSRPQAGNPNCNVEECLDERLLDRLPEMIRDAKRDLVVVLHQKGSHGPAYWKRYPDKFAKWTPVCQTTDFEKCANPEIVAAYDNTILYTDYFLSQAIDTLRKGVADAGVDAALVYFSDHGESLGENHLYLHGTPYFLSPDEQRHVPMMMWLSDGWLSSFRIDGTCLAARSGQAYSHDNIFHSVLGMLRISTAVYDPKLDIFQPCSR